MPDSVIFANVWGYQPLVKKNPLLRSDCGWNNILINMTWGTNIVLVTVIDSSLSLCSCCGACQSSFRKSRFTLCSHKCDHLLWCWRSWADDLGLHNGSTTCARRILIHRNLKQRSIYHQWWPHEPSHYSGLWWGLRWIDNCLWNSRPRGHRGRHLLTACGR